MITYTTRPNDGDTLHTITATFSTNDTLENQNRIRADFMVKVKEVFGYFDRSCYTVKTNKNTIILTVAGYVF